MDLKAITTSGEKFAAYLKAVVFPDGKCVWEIRRVLDAMGFGTVKHVKYVRAKQI